MDPAHVLVDGLGGRQGLYVALSRGRDGNYAYCVTEHPRLADTHEGTRAAPELDRARRLARERAGKDRRLFFSGNEKDRASAAFESWIGQGDPRFGPRTHDSGHPSPPADRRITRL